MSKKKTCWTCVNRRNIPGNCHISCAKPDPKMTANEHGIQNGWFYYPFNFDPVWMTKDCSNYESTHPTDDSKKQDAGES